MGEAIKAHQWQSIAMMGDAIKAHQWQSIAIHRLLSATRACERERERERDSSIPQRSSVVAGTIGHGVHDEPVLMAIDDAEPASLGQHGKPDRLCDAAVRERECLRALLMRVGPHWL